MKEITVSIIVPIYNVEKFLARCLDSLINQTLKGIEIICINDGSTDKSFQKLQEYAQKDNRIVVINQEHQGVSIARNKGLEIAQGEFIGFVDSDDWVDLDFYEKLYDSVVRNDCDIAIAGIIQVHSNKTKKHLEYKKEQCTKDIKEKFIITDIPKSCYVWNKIYKTKNLKALNIKFPEGKYFEDMIFTPQVVAGLGKLCTANSFYNYYRHSNSIVRQTNRNQKMQEDCKFAHDFVRKYLQEICPEVLDTMKVEHKYKVLGITLLKTTTQKGHKTYKLFNFIKIPFIS
jgi:glycosyltransferase involved in cell wall biosynthesis